MTEKHKGNVMERREHSPLPWTVGRSDRIEAANGRVVADMTFSSHSQQRAPANAALIVESVNQHDTLVEQRDLLVAALREVAIPSLKYCEQKYDHDDQARLNLEATLELLGLATVEQGGEV